jgi:hypothetical protein
MFSFVILCIAHKYLNTKMLQYYYSFLTGLFFLSGPVALASSNMRSAAGVVWGG